jgi:serine/threonine protein kinase
MKNELAGQNLGGYQLKEEIGRGSMGVVYRGKQIALGRDVAIKVLPQALAHDASYIARFIREAQIIAGLNHPNIVHIYDAGQQNKLLYFVMEFVEGPTLASLLHLDGSIPDYLAVEYAADIADALDVAYKERHVIHRDIKPENLMLNRWGKIKIMDFGLARAPGHQQITVAKTLVGSIYYASPEQVWGHQLDNRSDIYALGVVLYEMVCGQRPFTGRSMPELTRAITQGHLQPPGVHNPAIPPELEAIIMTTLATDREQRYEEAGLMARHLRSLNLQAPQVSPSTIPPHLSAQFHPGRERITLQPPKRPQVQRPRYYDVDRGEAAHLHIDQPQASSLSRSPQSEMSFAHSQKIQDIHGPTNPSLPTYPVQEHSPYQPQSIHPLANTADKITAQLETVRKTLNKRKLWHQLQRFFKPSS